MISFLRTHALAFCLAGVLLYLPAVPAQAQPQKFFKSLCARCERKLQAARANAYNALTRKAVRTRLERRAKTLCGDEYLLHDLTPYTAFYAREPHIPPFPLEAAPDEIYRGMTLNADGADLRHILKKGMEVSKCHYENFRAYNRKQYPDGQKAVYATPRLKTAVDFALDDTRFDRHLPVVFHLKKVSDDIFVSIPHDVPPSWIYRVSALLTLNGHAVWGEIIPHKNGFIFRPYKPGP